MSGAVPTTTQPVKSFKEIQDEDSESETELSIKKETCWQRFCSTLNKCFKNATDCLDFWCCRNECYNFCCKDIDVDDDEEDVYDDGENVYGNNGNEVAMTVIGEEGSTQATSEQSESKPLAGSEEIITQSDSKPQKDHSLQGREHHEAALISNRQEVNTHTIGHSDSSHRDHSVQGRDNNEAASTSNKQEDIPHRGHSFQHISEELPSYQSSDHHHVGDHSASHTDLSGGDHFGGGGDSGGGGDCGGGGGGDD